ncbi:hypothetical protein BC834DRAFT_548794 [Gloeopeniophorella convolvens]|nr:hypothetical protein BC834DRAFT_548794 [Gloeopeniophorella convolvens]
MDYYGVRYIAKGWYVTTNLLSLPGWSLWPLPRRGPNAYGMRPLDCHIGIGPQGTIVRQRLIDPTANPLWQTQNILAARLVFPIYFPNPGSRMFGCSISEALGRSERDNQLHLWGSADASFDTRHSVHLHISWPGYPDWFTEVDIAVNGRDTVYGSLLYQTAQAVDKFMQSSYGLTPADGQEMWTIGPGAITRDDVGVVGIINIALHHWQPIIQLSRSALLPCDSDKSISQGGVI